MQVIEFKKFGAPSQLKLVERPTPQADANTAVVRIEAASVNPSDVKNVAGRMEQTTLPRVPGRDYSGVVVDGPTEWLHNEVWGTGGDVGFTRDGSHAQYIQVPVASLVRKPETLSHEQAACVGVNFVTAWCALEYAKLSAGETFAVFGANGGVGGASIQIAKHPYFQIKGRDLLLDLPVTCYEAALGGKVQVPTLDSIVELTIPPRSNTGLILRVRGKGLPPTLDAAAGDLLITLRIVLPETTDPELDEFLKRWKQEHPYDPRKNVKL